MWLCPKCRLPLQWQERSLTCSQGHLYDRAKQGYCNLLLADKKNSRQPGDNKAMVQARRGFLDRGYYGPLLAKMCQLVSANAAQKPLRLLDMGCGEGYYLRNLARGLQLGPGQAMGIDISKEAVRSAAATHKQGLYAVASCYDIPLPEACVDVALSVFSPLCEQSLWRVLKPGGFALRVSPGAQHLAALKRRLYARAKAHQPPPGLAGFTRLHSVRVQGELHLHTRADIHNLLTMTPYFWHGSAAAKEQLLALNSLDIDMDFYVEFLQRSASRLGAEGAATNSAGERGVC